MNKNAQALGRMAKGKKKHFSPETIDALKKRLEAARKKRWAKDGKNEDEG